MSQGVSHPYRDKYPKWGRATTLPPRTTHPDYPLEFGSIWKALQHRELDRRTEVMRKGTHREKPAQPRDLLRAEDPSYVKPPVARKGRKLKPKSNLWLLTKLGLLDKVVAAFAPTPAPAPAREPMVIMPCSRCGKRVELGDMEARRWGRFCSTDCAEAGKPWVEVKPRFAVA